MEIVSYDDVNLDLAFEIEIEESGVESFSECPEQSADDESQIPTAKARYGQRRTLTSCIINADDLAKEILLRSEGKRNLPHKGDVLFKKEIKKRLTERIVKDRVPSVRALYEPTTLGQPLPTKPSPPVPSKRIQQTAKLMAKSVRDYQLERDIALKQIMEISKRPRKTVKNSSGPCSLKKDIPFKAIAANKPLLIKGSLLRPDKPPLPRPDKPPLPTVDESLLSKVDTPALSMSVEPPLPLVNKPLLPIDNKSTLSKVVKSSLSMIVKPPLSKAVEPLHLMVVEPLLPTNIEPPLPNIVEPPLSDLSKSLLHTDNQPPLSKEVEPLLPLVNEPPLPVVNDPSLSMVIEPLLPSHSMKELRVIKTIGDYELEEGVGLNQLMEISHKSKNKSVKMKKTQNNKDIGRLCNIRAEGSNAQDKIAVEECREEHHVDMSLLSKVKDKVDDPEKAFRRTLGCQLQSLL